MIEIHHIPEAIQWYEGMLLAPQHFQQFALRHEELIHYHTMMIAPFHWGIHHLKIDEDALVSGLLRVLELEAVMPDGLIISHEFHDGEELEVNLKDYTEEVKQNEMVVYLALPVKKPIAVKGDLPRYDAVEGAEVPDANVEGGRKIPIPRLRPRICLQVTSEMLPSKYVGFPFLKVKYEDDKFTRTEFIPPYLITPSQIHDQCADIDLRLREQARLLLEESKLPSLVKNTLIRDLVAALPYFEAILKTEKSHPYTMYLALCSLAGHLATFGPKLPPEFDAYNHNDLYSTFHHVIEFIYQMIKNVPIRFSAFRFRFDNGIFRLSFKGEWPKRGLIIGVRRQRELLESAVINWVAGCLIGSASKISSMRENRILGVGRRMVEGGESLAPAGDETLFALEDDSEFIEKNEVLQIWNPDDLDNAQRLVEINLYVPIDESTDGDEPLENLE